MSIAPITTADLTTATVEGTGVFDVLMRAARAHLDQEYKAQRIRGPEYSSVYLGAMEAVLAQATEFLLNKDQAALQSQLIEQQIQLAEVEVQKAQVQIQILEQEKLKIAAEVALSGAQKALVEQQTLNAVTENAVLQAQECKLRAEYDVLMLQKPKTEQETQLLLWKVNTEKSQTVGAGTEPDSVVGKQKALYQAQTDGFQRDAEQKAAKLMIDSWNVRRTTDSGTVADSVNQLNDASVGRVVARLMQGIQA